MMGDCEGCAVIFDETSGLQLSQDSLLGKSEDET